MGGSWQDSVFDDEFGWSEELLFRSKPAQQAPEDVHFRPHFDFEEESPFRNSPFRSHNNQSSEEKRYGNRAGARRPQRSPSPPAAAAAPRLAASRFPAPGLRRSDSLSPPDSPVSRPPQRVWRGAAFCMMLEDLAIQIQEKEEREAKLATPKRAAKAPPKRVTPPSSASSSRSASPEPDAAHASVMPPPQPSSPSRELPLLSPKIQSRDPDGPWKNLPHVEAPLSSTAPVRGAWETTIRVTVKLFSGERVMENVPLEPEDQVKDLVEKTEAKLRKRVHALIGPGGVNMDDDISVGEAGLQDGDEICAVPGRDLAPPAGGTSGLAATAKPGGVRKFSFAKGPNRTASSEASPPTSPAPSSPRSPAAPSAPRSPAARATEAPPRNASKGSSASRREGDPWASGSESDNSGEDPFAGSSFAKSSFAAPRPSASPGATSARSWASSRGAPQQEDSEDEEEAFAASSFARSSFGGRPSQTDAQKPNFSATAGRAGGPGAGQAANASQRNSTTSGDFVESLKGPLGISTLTKRALASIGGGSAQGSAAQPGRGSGPAVSPPGRRSSAGPAASPLSTARGNGSVNGGSPRSQTSNSWFGAPTKKGGPPVQHRETADEKAKKAEDLARRSDAFWANIQATLGAAAPGPTAAKRTSLSSTHGSAMTGGGRAATQDRRGSSVAGRKPPRAR